MILGQSADPQVDGIDAAVNRSNFACRPIARDLREARHPRQSIGDARGVVVGQTVIAAALDVERGQIEPAGAGRAEEEIAQPGTSCVSTSRALSVARYFRIGSGPFSFRAAGLKKPWQLELRADRVSVIVEELDVVVDERMPDAKAAVENSVAIPGFTSGL